MYPMDPREAKVFVKLGEECAEIQQELAKTLLYGPYSYNPLEPQAGNNSERLERELGDLMHWVGQAAAAGLIRPYMIQARSREKAMELGHQHILLDL